MKNKRIIGFLISSIALALLTGCNNKKEKEHQVEKREVTVYESLNDKYNINAYFIDDIDCPYLKIDELLNHRMTEPEEIGFPIPNLKLSYSSGVLKASNIYHNKDYYIEFDAINDQIRTKNYLKAIDVFNYGCPCDPLGADRSPITISTSKELEDNHEDVIFDLGKFEIELVSYENSVLVPLYELNNIYFVVGEKNFVYNGKDIFLKDSYYSGASLFYEFFHIKSTDGITTIYNDGYTPNQNLNPSTVLFNRNAILETFEDFYGRYDELGYDIIDFAKMIGSYDLLSSTKPQDIYKGLGILAEGMDDLHTNILYSSAYAGYLHFVENNLKSYEESTTKGRGFRATSYNKAKESNKSKRSELLSDKEKTGYYYEGETLFIRFDGFNRANNKSVFNGKSLNSVSYSSNTFNLFYDAMKDLKNHSEIKNIVIDESINGGGDFTTLVEIAGFFMEEVRIVVKNKITNQVYDISYKVDTNLDGIYNEEDHPGSNYNVYLMCSESSFSCANCLPTIFRYNNIGSIIGRTTAGGSCIVYPTSSPIGDTYRISSQLEYGLLNSDSVFIHADMGIHPDYYFPNDVLYDQVKLNSILNDLR